MQMHVCFKHLFPVLDIKKGFVMKNDNCNYHPKRAKNSARPTPTKGRLVEKRAKLIKKSPQNGNKNSNLIFRESGDSVFGYWIDFLD